jgi:hypothetical protein
MSETKTLPVENDEPNRPASPPVQVLGIQTGSCHETTAKERTDPAPLLVIICSGQKPSQSTLGCSFQTRSSTNVIFRVNDHEPFPLNCLRHIPSASPPLPTHELYDGTLESPLPSDEKDLHFPTKRCRFSPYKTTRPTDWSVSLLWSV